jgi:uncharacterized cupredoxin-like copper-binding protein
VAPGTGGLRVWVGSGNSTTVSWTVPATGELLLMCHLPGHLEQGMVGRVELRDEPSGSPVAGTPD